MYLSLFFTVPFFSSDFLFLALIFWVFWLL